MWKYQWGSTKPSFQYFYTTLTKVRTKNISEAIICKIWKGARNERDGSMKLTEEKKTRNMRNMWAENRSLTVFMETHWVKFIILIGNINMVNGAIGYILVCKVKGTKDICVIFSSCFSSFSVRVNDMYRKLCLSWTQISWILDKTFRIFFLIFYIFSWVL